MRSENVIPGAGGASGKKRGKNGFCGKIMLFPRLFCLLIAFILWIYVVNISTDDYEKTFTMIDIKVEGTDELTSMSDISIYDQSEGMVSITVSGTRQDISGIETSDFIAYIDVSGIREAGRVDVPVKVSVPETVSLVSFSPSSITVYTDVKITKEVPVSVDISSYSMASNYEFGAAVPKTGSVSVTGPAAVVGRIAEASAKVDLNSQWVTSSFVHNAGLVFLDASGAEVSSKFVTSDVTQIDIEVSVIMTAELRLTYTLDTGTDASDIQSVRISPQTLKVAGDPQTVSSMTRLSVVTVGKESPSEITVDVSSLTLPSGLEFRDAPEKITVYVVPAPVVTEPVTEPPASTEQPPEETTPEETDAPGE